jgi:protocatechuate 3,4-dioxygenase alpha subunit
VPSLGRTPSQTVGPFFGFALIGSVDNELVAPDAPGAVRITGSVIDGEGDPVPDALVEIWQADAEGRYAAGNGFAGLGRSGTDEGGFSFVTVKPGAVPDADGALQAPHLVVAVFARGLLKHLVTRMYFPDEQEANEADPLLSVLEPAERATLIAQPAADGLRFDIRLQGEGQTVFLAV